MLLLLLKTKPFLFEKHFLEIVKEAVFIFVSCWATVCLESFIWAMGYQPALPYNELH